VQRTAAREIWRFGPFHLDSSRRRLTNDGMPVHLAGRQMDVLLVLVAQAGAIVAKDALVDAAWGGEAVTDDSIMKAISGLRQALGPRPDGGAYIETFKRQGYRFSDEVSVSREAEPLRLPPDRTPALWEPYRALVDGQSKLETLNRDDVDRAAEAFAEALAAAPNFAGAHIGLANACFLRFESTRADREPDAAALARAEHHARLGCRLDPESGHAWSTLAVVCHRRSPGAEAIAAARKAVDLEPDEWRHHLRLAFVSWGGVRLRAACKVLDQYPAAALAHWLAATVYVARQAFDRALEHLRAGCAAQDTTTERGLFAPVGLHLLHGLVLAATDEVPAAIEACTRELAGEASNHIYARESAGNASYAIGALHLRAGKRDQASAAFADALARMPGHALALIGLAAASPGDAHFLVPRTLDAQEGTNEAAVERAIAHAAMYALQERHADAAQLVKNALAQAAAGQAGWQLPVEPLLNVAAHPDAWTRAIALLANRAA
jgi:DNA-binding winged helix-turn-helix (wHTH) protein